MYSGVFLGGSSCHTDNLCKHTHDVWEEKGKCFITFTISSAPFLVSPAVFFACSWLYHFLLPVLIHVISPASPCEVSFVSHFKCFIKMSLLTQGKMTAHSSITHKLYRERWFCLVEDFNILIFFPAVIWKKAKKKIPIFQKEERIDVWWWALFLWGHAEALHAPQWLQRSWAAATAGSQGDCQQRLGRWVGLWDLVRVLSQHCQNQTTSARPFSFYETASS